MISHWNGVTTHEYAAGATVDCHIIYTAADAQFIRTCDGYACYLPQLSAPITTATPTPANAKRWIYGMDNTPGGDERSKLLQSCKALIFKWASVHFKSYLEKMEEQLFRMAEKAGSNQEQNRYMQAHAALRDQHRAIEQRLLEHLSKAFRNYLEQRDTAIDFNQADTGLALVDNDVLERSIALSNMTRRTSADCSDALYALNQRLSVIGGGYKVLDLTNPVAPGVFVECLQTALHDLALETPALLVVYKIYDTIVMAKLTKLYDLLNHDLKSKGILTHLRYQARKHEAPMLPEELAALVSEQSQVRQSDLMATVQKLQAALMAGRTQPASITPTPLIVQELHPVQRQSAQRFVVNDAPNAFAQTPYTEVLPEIEAQKQHASSIDADTIEIVGLLFDYVLNDEQLPDSVKALLSYLHTPFLKVALLDKEFFNHPQHPARLLLNSLVAAGERWVEPEGKHKSDVFQQIKNLVKRILDDFDDDVRLFSQLAFEFNHYLRQHVRRVRLSEQRALQAARGEDKLKEIRLKVERYLQQKIAQQKNAATTLPVEIRTLLFEPWANVLAFNLLRFGSKSEQWRDATHTIDDMLRYLRAEDADASSSNISITADEQQAQRQQLRNSVEERLLAGFQTVGYEADQGQRLLRALHDYHERNLQYAPKNASITARNSTTPTAPLDIDAVLSEPTTADPILQQLNALEFGTWFLFRADQPVRAQYRAKLAWYNARTQHFMFVNRLGQQVAVRMGADLANDIRAGRVRIQQQLDEKPFFEKALERIAEQLRRRPR